MTQDPFERAARDLGRALERQAAAMRAQIDQARREIQAAMDHARRGIERERAELTEMMDEYRRRGEGPRGWTRPEDWAPRRKRPGSRPRKPRGGEPALVEPRPKPKPLVDGAEAPIE